MLPPTPVLRSLISRPCKRRHGMLQQHAGGGRSAWVRVSQRGAARGTEACMSHCRARCGGVCARHVLRGCENKWVTRARQRCHVPPTRAPVRFGVVVAAAVLRCCGENRPPGKLSPRGNIRTLRPPIECTKRRWILSLDAKVRTLPRGLVHSALRGCRSGAAAARISQGPITIVRDHANLTTCSVPR